jgi:hypothetical protein
MDAVTSLIGNKLFKTFYDPTADNLAAQYRASSASNLNSLQDSLAKATDTKDILSKIPGVSGDTQAQMDALLKENADFTKGAADLSPTTVAAKKDDMNKKMNTLVKQAQDEAATKKKEEAAAAAAKKKEEKENQTFSFTRLLKRMWDQGKWILFYIGLTLAALLGGSMSSNAAIQEPWYFRLYYFIFGSLLFPVSYIFAIMRYIKGQGGAYHAILVPLVEEPVSKDWYRYIFYPFLYNGVDKLTPLPVEPVADPQHNSEEAVLAAAYRPRPAPEAAEAPEIQYRPRPDAKAAEAPEAPEIQYRPRPAAEAVAVGNIQYRPRPAVEALEAPEAVEATEAPQAAAAGNIQYRPRPTAKASEAAEAVAAGNIQYRPRPAAKAAEAAEAVAVDTPVDAAVTQPQGTRPRPKAVPQEETFSNTQPLSQPQGTRPQAVPQEEVFSNTLPQGTRPRPKAVPQPLPQAQTQLQEEVFSNTLLQPQPQGTRPRPQTVKESVQLPNTYNNRSLPQTVKEPVQLPNTYSNLSQETIPNVIPQPQGSRPRPHPAAPSAIPQPQGSRPRPT